MALDLSPFECDITIWRGDNPALSFTFTDADTGDPLDLSGTSLLFTVNPSPDGSLTDIFQRSPENTLDNTGVATFQPTTAETDIEPQSYYYDVQWTSGSTVRTLARGRFIVQSDVTN